MRQARLLAPRGWWRRAPFLPLPSASYLRFRLLTQYGTTDVTPSGEDVISFLKWCRGQPR